MQLWMICKAIKAIKEFNIMAIIRRVTPQRLTNGGIVTTSENRTPNIDFDFIKNLEGFITEAKVPAPEKSKSGVTIASGFDLGARTPQDLKRIGVPDTLVQKLSPYTGKKRFQAQKFLEKNPLKISEDEADLLNYLAKKETTEALINRFEKDFKKPFTALPKEAQTVLGSLGYQYGLKDKGLPSHNFWKQMGTENYKDALENLKNYGDDYPTRRKKEADYLKSLLTKPSS